MDSRVIRVEASAGSGKTYLLSTRYLQLISEMFPTFQGGMGTTPPLHNACRKPVPSKERLPSSIAAVLAITFTNKAAAEMKERILLTLKEIILKGKTIKGFKVRPEEAEKMLFHLIENYSDLNIMTIDAFMNTILKAFAIELGRLPDYELSFSPGKFYTLTLDRLMERGERMRPIFQSFLDHLLTVERKGGFNPERMIRNALFELKEAKIRPEHLPRFSSYDFDEDKEWEPIERQLEDFYARLAEVQERYQCFKATSVKPSRHLQDLKTKKLPPWIIDGRDIASLIRKGRSCPELASLSQRLSEIREASSSYFTRLEAKKFFRVMEMFQVTLDEEATLYQELNLFDGSKLPEKVQDLLTRDSRAVPAAFCKLGERYVHYLIDEFQDTSRSQWEGMQPLVENSLAEGGSLFYVGDAKQAIYGWRGGDYRLMEDAFRTFPSVRDDRRQIRRLQMNWRSADSLVTFFNTLFDPSGLETVMPSFVDEPTLNDLKRIYETSRQIPRKTGPSGIVGAQFFRIPKGDTDPLQHPKEAFFDTLAEVRKSYPDKDILILGRKNEDIELIAGWLFEQPTPIPFVTEQSLKLFAIPPVKSLLNLLSYLAVPDGNLYLHALIHDGLFGELPQKTIEEILSNYTADTPFETFFQATFPELDTHYLAPLRRLSVFLSPYELTREIITRFSLDERFPDYTPLYDRLLEQVFLQEQKGNLHLREVMETFYETVEETRLTLPETPEAIRLMTIHKAKGLEAKVVMIPLLNWSMKPATIKEIVELIPGQYAQLRTNLRKHNPIAEAKWQEIHKKTFIENFNLLYVAVTRAQEALYLFAPFTEEGKTIGEIFYHLCRHHGYLSETASSFLLGRPHPKRSEKRKRKQPPPPPSSRRIHAEDIRVRLRLPPDTAEESWTDEHARRLGNIAHLALSTLSVIPPETSIEDAAEDALSRALSRTGLRIEREMARTLERHLKTALRNLEAYFRNVEKAWTEKEFVSQDGEIIRIDRMVRKGNDFYLLEFKSGKKMDTHYHQLKRYLEIVRPVGRSSPLHGILYYLDTGESVHV